jgi:hypothetical protein
MRFNRHIFHFLLMTLPMVALFQNCTDNYKIDAVNPEQLAVASIPVCTFNGHVVPEGQSTTAFHDSTEPFGSTCSSQQRTCTNGQLSGTYAFGSCAVAAPKACLFNGQTVSSGSSVTAFNTSSVAFGQTCVSQSRLCTDGVLSGQYTYGSCAPDAPVACLFNGQTVASGTGITAYSTSTVAFGQTCIAQTRNCINGTLSGSYTFGSCAPNAPVSCLFNGQTVPAGNSVTAYQASSVPFGQTCVSEQETCTNGVLSGNGYAFASCVPNTPAACSFNGQTYPSGTSVTAYKDASVDAGGTCTSQSRTCTNGALSGSYTNASCTVAVCDPFTAPGPNCSSSSPGLHGSLFYEPQSAVASQGGWNSLSTYFSQGVNTNITLVLSQLNVPTENFSVGFPIGNGIYLSDLDGNKLVEWFALQVDGVLKLAPGDTAGNYEFALLSDDGSILYLRDPSTGQLVPRIQNDGAHSTQLACIDSAIAMDSTTQIPMRLQYFQGPRTEIAIRMLYRKASSTRETLCGTSSNFFVNTGTGNPYPEGTSMTKLYNDGWKVLTSNMFGSPQ